MTWSALLAFIGEKTKTAWLVAGLTVAGLVAVGFVADRVERRRRAQPDFDLWRPLQGSTARACLGARIGHGRGVMTTRLPGNDQRTTEVVKHFAATLEHLGRALHALEQDNWDSARTHLSLVGERASIANVCLNVGFPDAQQAMSAVREQLPKQWADVVAGFLAGMPSPAPAVQDKAVTDGA